MHRTEMATFECIALTACAIAVQASNNMHNWLQLHIAFIQIHLACLERECVQIELAIKIKNFPLRANLHTRNTDEAIISHKSDWDGKLRGLVHLRQQQRGIRMSMSVRMHAGVTYDGVVIWAFGCMGGVKWTVTVSPCSHQLELLVGLSLSFSFVCAVALCRPQCNLYCAPLVHKCPLLPAIYVVRKSLQLVGCVRLPCVPCAPQAARSMRSHWMEIENYSDSMRASVLAPKSKFVFVFTTTFVRVKIIAPFQARAMCERAARIPMRTLRTACFHPNRV